MADAKNFVTLLMMNKNNTLTNHLNQMTSATQNQNRTKDTERLLNWSQKNLKKNKKSRENYIT